mmetsp:Transcript_32161/g.51154  ORF Transcript_32161/g.51154 Transcript_32161/m.51154 type:complete len:143 (-) Transcript_32161:622-1050(-)
MFGQIRRSSQKTSTGNIQPFQTAFQHFLWSSGFAVSRQAQHSRNYRQQILSHFGNKSLELSDRINWCIFQVRTTLSANVYFIPEGTTVVVCCLFFVVCCLLFVVCCFEILLNQAMKSSSKNLRISFKVSLRKEATQDNPRKP